MSSNNITGAMIDVTICGKTYNPLDVMTIEEAEHYCKCGQPITKGRYNNKDTAIFLRN